jgi:tetratricopeptide (TPR) repeat protein
VTQTAHRAFPFPPACFRGKVLGPMSYGALASSHLVTEGRFEEAVAQASQEIAALPDEPEAYFNRAQALTALGRLEDAVDDYEAALRLDASSSSLDPAAVDDELFFALRSIAVAHKDRPADALDALERYRRALPQGRHIADLQTWIDHVNGVTVVWYRDRA